MKHIRITPYQSAANNLVKRAVKNLMVELKKIRQMEAYKWNWLGPFPSIGQIINYNWKVTSRIANGLEVISTYGLFTSC